MGGSSASQKIIGYYEGWSTTGACKGIQPENLLMGLAPVWCPGWGSLTTRVFDDTGLFQNNWPSTTYTSLSNLVGTWSGKIADTFIGILGRTADTGLNHQYIANFHLCDADYNSYKEHIVAGEKFISDKLLAEYNPLEQIEVLSDMIDMMSGYLSHVDVVASYASTYTSIKTLWGATFRGTRRHRGSRMTSRARGSRSSGPG